MDQDIFDEDVDELSFISNDWKNIASIRKKEGYKEGIDRGQQVTMQEGFDEGFKEGFASTVLMSKIKGIINGLMEFRRSYEGNPINDQIALEAQLILDLIDQLEANNIVGDMLDLNLSSNKKKSGTGCGNCNCGKSEEEEDIMDMDVIQLDDQPCYKQNAQNKINLDYSISKESLDPIRIEQTIGSSNEIKDILQRCRKVLNNIGWKDDLHKLLLSID